MGTPNAITEINNNYTEKCSGILNERQFSGFFNAHVESVAP